LRYSNQIASGLAELAASVVHRDVASRNILVHRAISGAAVTLDSAAGIGSAHRCPVNAASVRPRFEISNQCQHW
jgi:hypothetical protein